MLGKLLNQVFPVIMSYHDVELTLIQEGPVGLRLSVKAGIGRVCVVRKCIWGGSCKTGGKIKIPLWPAVNLRLLTAQRSCCVMGFLMALQQSLPRIALTWFIASFAPPHYVHHPPTAVPPSSSQHHQSNIQFLPLSPSVFIDTYCILCAQGYNVLFSITPVAENICL